MTTTKLKLPEITIKLKIKNKPTQELAITNSEDAANFARKIISSDLIEWQEQFVILCLNRANKVMGFYKVSAGGRTGTVADPRNIFTIALNSLATGLILIHNHPSGNLRPSAADNELTRKIKEGGQLLDITIMDHIILTSDSYYSYMDEGQL